ncbi:MAG TPA: hypothetical protein VES67_19955 [Vicinamibacterales bacterium]|nr:hypothetical protein [Vicinamibacterales bacterium]
MNLIGDIDLCEYVDGSLHSMADVVERAVAVSDDDLLCIEIKAHAVDERERTQSVHKLQLPCSHQNMIAFLQSAATALRAECDYVAITASQGPIEVTKVVLVVDPAAAHSEVLEFSFAFQEAPLTEFGGWLPRRLVAPEALGKYVAWLFAQISSPGSTSYAKMAKRARALARLLFLPDVVRNVDQMLATSGFGHAEVLESRVALFRRLRASPESERLSRFREATADQLKTLTRSLDPSSALQSRCLATLNWKQPFVRPG